jgi:predicted signal transduction protein with EAL and GGDEF domain
MGHQVGDTFLKYIADCLKAEVEEPNFIARMGGDEFVIIYFNISKEHLLENIEKIRDHISRSWSIQNHQFYVSMSVGVVMYPRDGDNLTELMKHSDIAMNTAKREGRNRILFYEEDIKEINSWHVRMINNLQYAISEEQFILYYQPQFKLDTGEITGMEALVRWVHPEDGAIAPSVFIPLAEETGQIYSLERWIVAKALEQKKIWEDNGFHEIVLSINLSGKTLTSEMNFVELEHILSVASVDYSKIVIEITETANISDVDIVIGHLERLKRLGLRVALDDFGTGFSSLIYMKKFPIDIIKLDKSFIHSIQEGGIDTLLIKNIIYLAHDLKYEVVAEGIESKEQLDYLRQYYCESGQGYLLSRPLPKENIDALLNNNFHFKD